METGRSVGGGFQSERGKEKRRMTGWKTRRDRMVGFGRSDRREDSITRHQQPGAYLVAIGFSLPKASPALYQIVHSATLIKLIGTSTDIEGRIIIDHLVHAARAACDFCQTSEIKERTSNSRRILRICRDGSCVKVNTR